MRSRDIKEASFISKGNCPPKIKNKTFDFPAFLTGLCDTGLVVSDSVVTKSEVDPLPLNLTMELMRCGLSTEQRPELLIDAR